VITIGVALAENLRAERAAQSRLWIAYSVTGLILLTITCAAIYVWWAVDNGESRGGDSNDGDGGDGGGPDRGGGGIPPRGSPDTDPEWWPEFEREFADHVACLLGPRADRASAAPRIAGCDGSARRSRRLTFRSPDHRAGAWCHLGKTVKTGPTSRFGVRGRKHVIRSG
jgi:hypothetical protein